MKKNIVIGVLISIILAGGIWATIYFVNLNKLEESHENNPSKETKKVTSQYVEQLMKDYNLSTKTRYYNQNKFSVEDYTNAEKLALVLPKAYKSSADDSVINVISVSDVEKIYHTMFPDSEFLWDCKDSEYCKVKYDNVCESFSAECKTTNLESEMIIDKKGTCNLLDSDAKKIYYYKCAGGYSTPMYEEYSYQQIENKLILKQQIMLYENTALNIQNNSFEIFKDFDRNKESIVLSNAKMSTDEEKQVTFQQIKDKLDTFEFIFEKNDDSNEFHLVSITKL